MELAPGESGYVLLFEDTIEDERLALRSLKASYPNLKVCVARDGYEALNLLGLGAETPLGPLPDLVISDLKMPKFRGDELLQLIRDQDRLKALPFVIFSSSDEPGDRIRCMEWGASGYCTKPMDYLEFKSCLQGMIQRYMFKQHL